ncbi:MAG: type 2 isopentenyl-diphosphate Delta-isomerase [Nitrososphaerota archaeon]|nr:type 2 isopentenyl-diphosphate Delta-isomerase [Nitrososphaerota archaeon]
MSIVDRKRDHLEICLKEDVNARRQTTMLEDVHLLHNALPELNIDEIRLDVEFLGHRLKAPLLIDSMTGGTQMSYEINRALATAAEEAGIGIGVGSQRAGLKRPDVAETYSVVRKAAPNAFIFGNVGAAQLVKGMGVAEAKKAVEMIDADALAIHANPLQEAVQVGGDPQYSGATEKIRLLAESLDVPVIVKEVGAGISGEVASRLQEAGAKAINVSGVGGTSWSGVESIRARRAKEGRVAGLGEAFWDWGIPTAAALVEVRRSVSVPVIASGGIRGGIDMAKCMALGADVCAMARPFLLAAADGGKEGVLGLVESLTSELRLAMFLTGSRDPSALRRARKVVTGRLGEWMRGTTP